MLGDVAFIWHELRAPCHCTALVCPLSDCIDIGTDVFGTPARPCFGLALEGRVRRAKNRLADIVEAVRRVVGHLLAKFIAGEPRLEFFNKIRLVSRLADRLLLCWPRTVRGGKNKTWKFEPALGR